tara:strand:+ start:2679 stop:3092 length:414 start_codon:yes stop_codon:yes gene_type:complete
MPRGVSANEFTLELKNFGKVTREQATTIFQKIALELDSAVVFGTPVDEGRARGNWYPSLNAPSNEVDLNSTDKSGSKAVAAINALVSTVKIGDTFWLTNNLPYILPLENGHSKQAPEGMVDINLNRVQAFYGGVIKR